MVEPVRGVIFDLHSTLVDQGHAGEWVDRALERAPHPLNASQRSELEDFLDRIWETARIQDPASSRDLSFEDHRRVFHDLLAAGPAVEATLSEALYQVLLDTWHAYEDTVPTLQAIKSAGLSVCLLSNIGVPIRPVLDREGITPWVDAVVLSCEVGVVKPDPLIFQAALDALAIPASAALMVGDSGRDDTGGIAIGIRTLILPRTKGPIHGLHSVTQMLGCAP
jgi:HAD superfamily hydrolase (TIGR01549 family)